RLEHSFRSESASKPFLSFDKDTSHLVIGDAEERKRLAQIAAKAVFDALGQSLDQDDDEKKAP
ncbi:DNA-binding protein, partial [Acinetobacter baumannii]|nr:DNA-binding protein [Acinetobacter baumannii]